MRNTALCMIFFSLAGIIVTLRHQQSIINPQDFLRKYGKLQNWDAKNPVRPENYFYTPNKNSAQYINMVKGIGMPENQTVSLHHIFPGNKIIETIKNCKEEKQGLTMVHILNSIIQNKAIRSFLNKQKKDLTGREITEYLFGFIFWFKNNVIPGPLPSQRKSDPGSKVDTPLLNYQSYKYQNQIKNIEDTFKKNDYCLALKQFLSLPEVQNVIWSKSGGAPQKYGIKKSTGLKTVGFIY